ncbi:D-alanine--D-alanine ligase [Rickettsia endosymbiont of Cardiosporidium cionae]|uniref:D-alanine--D-alanine ligase n=1 Tax=Rickettsia endosymbiont of Cardiosporidium cionae TaxID=2777155 RepID=UPI001893CED7|nr:D-alanine--D-alanine ligase [Rickettsia endosymbiont of Cardiosporidium cionae]KAF8818221.1 D-alanine--D-alanine ligase [Rickettsia endosymbiont of Cardiosporidium cionae]
MKEINRIKQSKIIKYSELNIQPKDIIEDLKKYGTSVNILRQDTIKNQKKHLVVLGGGMSSEAEISYKSAAGIIEILINTNYYVSFVDMGRDVYEALVKLEPDIVFNALHGTYSEDGCIAGLLNIMKIPYTSSGVLTSGMLFNKNIANIIFKFNNVITNDYTIISKNDHIIGHPIDPPYVIKPLSQGSSIGVEVIFESDNFCFSNYQFKYGDQVIVEPYIKGRELQVVVLDGKALGIAETPVAKNKRFRDYETKYFGPSIHMLPAPINKDLYSQILKISEKLFNILQCKSIIRIEFIYDEKNNKYYLLEINTNPGIYQSSVSNKIANFYGITYKELVLKILETASFENE